MAVPPLYPPSPPDVPARLSRPTLRHRLQDAVLLGCVVAFFAGYLALLVGSGLAAVLLLYAAPMGSAHNRLLPATFLGFLAAYLLVNLVSRRRPRRTADIELSPAEQPRLFEFIRQVCADLHIPPPEYVLVDFDVNADALFARRTLRVGLGAVSCTSLSEFKALLAHELAHFSQPTMFLLRWAAAALRVAESALDRRNPIDQLLGRWRRGPLLATWPAVLIDLALAIVRWPLRGAHAVLLLASRACRRQAEFHADRVAAAAAGTEAVVRMLRQLDRGEENLRRVLSELETAAGQGRYTSDLFHYLERAAAVSLAAPGDNAGCWATHPATAERVRAVASNDVPGPMDERPAWLLFDDVEDLRRRVTHQYNRVYSGLVGPASRRS